MATRELQLVFFTNTYECMGAWVYGCIHGSLLLAAMSFRVLAVVWIPPLLLVLAPVLISQPTLMSVPATSLPAASIPGTQFL